MFVNRPSLSFFFLFFTKKVKTLSNNFQNKSLKNKNKKPLRNFKKLLNPKTKNTSLIKKLSNTNNLDENIGWMDVIIKRVSEAVLYILSKST